MVNQINTIKITNEEVGYRADVLLAELYPQFSRSVIQKLIKNNSILLNNKNFKPSTTLKIDDELTVSIPENENIEIVPENIPLDIKYEDDTMLVVNKPFGMLTHPTVHETSNTLVNALLHYTKGELSTCNGTLRPGIVHRLDRNTSGLLMIAKTDGAYYSLKSQMQNRTIIKNYYTVVCGNIEKDFGTINKKIGRSKSRPEKMAISDDGKDAITHYKVLERFNTHTFLDINLETGRTHQIRVHFSSIGHPIVNDSLYGGGKLPVKTTEQVLQAYSLKFVSPYNNTEQHILIEPDSDIIKVLNYLRSKK